jgi:UDP-glucuronate 4-epimerase
MGNYSSYRIGGFIGFHTAKRLLADGHTVVGVDNFNDYYDPRIKEERTAMLLKYPQFTLERGDLADLSFVK